MERESLALEVLQVAQKGDLKKWWKENSPDRLILPPWEEVEIMPTKPPEQLSGVIEIKGLSQSGKSEAFRYLQQNFSKSHDTVFQQELVVDSGLSGALEDWGKDKDRDRDVMIARYGADYQMLLWNIAKIVSFQNALSERIKEGKNYLISERGPNDVLAMGEMIAEHQNGRQELTRDEEVLVLFDDLPFDSNHYNLPRSNDYLLMTYFSGLNHASHVDAAILFGIPFETMCERRLIRDGAPEGKFNNKSNWPLLERSYGWWLGSTYPLLEKRCGMGLLVVDGTKPLDYNNKRVLDFCEKVAAMKNARN